jgi:phosphopantothenoylcysteine decarboxylase/phosphopantothenate--cysteine ligase
MQALSAIRSTPTCGIAASVTTWRISNSHAITAAIVIAPPPRFHGQLAQGHADDLLSTLCLARDCALLVAPRMNRQIVGHPATRRNAANLKRRRERCWPASGDQACGEIAPGRMLESQDIADAVPLSSRQNPRRRARADDRGPTFEAIDAVRGITNAASGKMGYAIARAAVGAGAKVTLISGPSSQPCLQALQRRMCKGCGNV